MNTTNTDKRQLRKIRKTLEKRMIANGMKYTLFTETQVLQFLRSLLAREFGASDIEIRQMIKNPIIVDAASEAHFMKNNPGVAYIVGELEVDTPDTDIVEVPLAEEDLEEIQTRKNIKKKGKK